MQGTVMKITNKQIIVLCEDGKFRNEPLEFPVPALGERISLQRDTAIARKRTWIPMNRWIAAIFIGLFVMLSFTALQLTYGGRAAAMVAIDINPSVEVLVNRQGKIEKLIHMSDDADTLIANIEILNMDFYEALQLLVSHAEMQGYINLESEETLVLLSVVNLNKSRFRIDLTRLAAMDQYDIALHYATNEEKEQAQAAGLTLNKYHIYQQGKELGIDLDIEDVRAKSVADTLIDSGLEAHSFFEEVRGIDTGDRKNGQQIDPDQSGKTNPDVTGKQASGDGLVSSSKSSSTDDSQGSYKGKGKSNSNNNSNKEHREINENKSNKNNEGNSAKNSNKGKKGPNANSEKGNKNKQNKGSKNSKQNVNKDRKDNSIHQENGGNSKKNKEGQRKNISKSSNGIGNNKDNHINNKNNHSKGNNNKSYKANGNNKAKDNNNRRHRGR